MVRLVSTRVQLWRAADLDRDGAFAYQWRTTTSRAPGRRSWTEGVLLAHPEDGVARLGHEVDGYMAAVAVLADLMRRTGKLPVSVDLRVEEPTVEPGPSLGSWGRRPRYDRPDRRGETLGERAARHRREERGT